jgi:hypothetical protein
LEGEEAGDFSEWQGVALTGVLFRENRKTAILDHALVREGDMIRGAKVLRIEKDRVVLQQKEKEITVRLGSA